MPWNRIEKRWWCHSNKHITHTMASDDGDGEYSVRFHVVFYLVFSRQKTGWNKEEMRTFFITRLRMSFFCLLCALLKQSCQTQRMTRRKTKNHYCIIKMKIMHIYAEIYYVQIVLSKLKNSEIFATIWSHCKRYSERTYILHSRYLCKTFFELTECNTLWRMKIFCGRKLIFVWRRRRRRQFASHIPYLVSVPMLLLCCDVDSAPRAVMNKIGMDYHNLPVGIVVI